ncbi:MAG: hypothetical protein GYB24_09535 [Rhodobacteraceae bacterium]|nr:hypothetical protein [Paracoccaceae bacterium]
MSLHLQGLIGAAGLLCLVAGVVWCIGWMQQRSEKNAKGGSGEDAASQD